MSNPHPVPFTSDFSTNPERINRLGRRPKIYTVLKQSGYSKDDIRTAFFEISWMNVAELKKKFENPKSPAIIKVIANCFNKAIMKGDYRYIAEIIQQTIGAPKQTLDANIIFEQPFFPDIKTIDITIEQPLLPDVPTDDIPK